MPNSEKKLISSIFQLSTIFLPQFLSFLQGRRNCTDIHKNMSDSSLEKTGNGGYRESGMVGLGPITESKNQRRPHKSVVFNRILRKGTGT